MRRQSIAWAIIVVCLMVLESTAVNAQSTHGFDVDIPFQFVITGRTMPAGNYRVERLDPSKPNIVMLKNSNSGRLQLVLAQRVENDKPNTAACLVFARRKGEYYLFQVWTNGAVNGNQISVPGARQRRDQRANSSSLVTVTAKGP